MRNLRNAFIIAAAGIVAGAFLASPELRAYAVATITSADIVDGTIQSVDIGSGQVKSSDIAGNAVTSAKIKDGAVKLAEIDTGAVGSDEILDGTIVEADLSSSLLKTVRLLDDSTGNSAGWDPDGFADFFVIFDSSVTDESGVFFSMAGVPLVAHFCSSISVTDGSFAFICDSPPENGRILNYVVIKPSSSAVSATADSTSDESFIRR